MSARPWRARRRALIPYVLMLPAVLVVALVVAVPIVQSFGYSFQHYQLRDLASVRFTGLDNYARALTDGLFWRAARSTLLWVGVVLPVQFAIGMALALLLNQVFRGRVIVRTAVLLPWIVPGAVVSLLWKWMLDGNLGVINDLLMRWGILDTGIPWLTQPSTAMPAVIVAMVWHGMPFFALMLLAALQSVPRELHEAASVDGASGVQRFRHITVPSIMDTIRTTTLLRIIWLANSIEIIWIMTSGGPAYSTTTLPMVTFIEATRGLDFGYASAVSVLLTLALLGIVVVYLRKMRESL